MVAREKFNLCLTKTAEEDDLFKVYTMISFESSFDITKIDKIPKIKRPTKTPPLLDEIIHILEITCHPAQPEVMARAVLIKDSNTSLSSQKSKQRKENIPCHEAALNILHTLSNLRNITKGSYSGSTMDLSSAAGDGTKSSSTSIGSRPSKKTTDSKRLSPMSRFYDECLHYLTAYGNHNDIVAFLVKHNQLLTALKYCIYQLVDSDIFVHTVFMPYIKQGRADTVINHMIDMDETLLIWKVYIIPLCRHLERMGFLNCLYHLQILFKDPVRASMTCVKFYTMNCSTYTELQANSFHLVNAQRHLQVELELCQWEEIKVNGSVRTDGQAGTSTSAEDEAEQEKQRTLLMKMDSRTLNSHINTIWRQMEVTKFLAKCEQDGRETIKLLPKVHIIL